MEVILAADSPLALTPSERAVADVVRREGPIPRSDVTDLTVLSQQSVHRLIDGLIDKRLMTLGPPMVRGRGKPSRQIQLNGEGATSFGLCINTDVVTLIAVDLTGAVLQIVDLDANPNDRSAVAGEVDDVTRDILRQLALDPGRVAGLGVSMQGYRTHSRTCFWTPDILDAWADIPVDELFRDVVEFPVFVENNATCGAIAELFSGVGIEHDCFGYLSFNYGFGGGVIWNGQPVYGSRWNAGELGKVFTHDQMPHRPALGELIERLSRHGIHVNSVKALRAAFDPDWPGVQDWLEEVSPQINLIIRTLTAILDPSVVVFGGEAPERLKALLVGICETPIIDRDGRLYPTPELVSSRIDGDPATLGAAMIPLKSLIFV